VDDDPLRNRLEPTENLENGSGHMRLTGGFMMLQLIHDHLRRQFKVRLTAVQVITAAPCDKRRQMILHSV